MLNLRVVQARYGDCLIVEFGSGKRRKHVLIDGGPTKVYDPYLRPELERIAASGGQIDLMVLSHIDNDHVVGLLQFMTDLKKKKEAGEEPYIRIRRIWHNAFKKILPELASEAADLEIEMLNQPVEITPLEGAETLPGGDDQPLEQPEDLEFGVGEGVRLQLADEYFGIPRNTAFATGLVELENARRPVRLAALRLYVLGPNQPNLNDLREKWIRWLDDKAGRVSFDVTTPVVKPDDNINNLSSIMLLVEGSRRSLLLTGDGRSQDIITGLEALGKLPPGGTCYVDVMKVPHHGSARNVVGELFERVHAGLYVLSADGLHGNPDWQTLLWLVDAARRQKRDIRIFATNWTASLRRLVKDFPPEENNYVLEVLPKGQTSALL